MLNQKKLNKTSCHFINGQWEEGNGIPFTSLNPATHEKIWEGHKGTQKECHDVFLSAQKSLAEWKQTPFDMRKKCLIIYQDYLKKHEKELAELISKETGKPLWESATEVMAAQNKITVSINAFEERCKEVSFEEGNAKMGVRYKPHGVTMVLGPFNFPVHIPNGQIVPALLAGNAVIFKPSELTPATATFLIEGFHQAGFPKGVIQLIQGDAKTAQYLMKEDIQGLYFTGSHNTGVALNRFFAERPEVILALEMGGNNPLIIDNIDNIEAAVYHTLVSAFITSGQRCSAARRVIIPNTGFGDAFLAELVKRTESIHPNVYTLLPEPFMGSVISEQAALAHIDAQKTLIQKGALPLLPMKHIKNAFLTPGILEVSEKNTLSDDEIFAPLIQIYRYSNMHDAIQMANNTKYGLSAGLFSHNKTHINLFYNEIHAGVLAINRPTTGASSKLPFGGIGHSGNHRPSAYFAADYCAYPEAFQETAELSLPEKRLTGL